MTFYFTAEERVDFRALVRDLAATFRTRIELRQIGARDQAKQQGGVGPCGKTLCCSSWITDFGVVSIKMAKEQGLPLNPSKISGVCGRLLCCLSYENDNYIQAKQQMPQIGAMLPTPSGPGKVVSVNVPKDSVDVMLESGAIIQLPVNASPISDSGTSKAGGCGSCGVKSGGGCGSCGSSGGCGSGGSSCGSGGCSTQGSGGCGSCGVKKKLQV